MDVVVESTMAGIFAVGGLAVGSRFVSSLSRPIAARTTPMIEAANIMYAYIIGSNVGYIMT